MNAEDRIAGLLAYNNQQVEKRRQATALLKEAVRMLPAGRSHLRDRIETFLSEIHA